MKTQPGSDTRRSYPAREAIPRRSHALTGRPVAKVDPLDGMCLDEEGNEYQLADKGDTKLIAVEHFDERRKSELQVLLEASVKGGKGHEPNANL